MNKVFVVERENLLSLTNKPNLTQKIRLPVLVRFLYRANKLESFYGLQMSYLASSSLPLSSSAAAAYKSPYGMIIIPPDCELEVENIRDSDGYGTNYCNMTKTQVTTNILTENSNSTSSINKMYGGREPYLSSQNASGSFVEMVVECPTERDSLLVVLDGANIGYSYGSGVFDAKGLVLAIEYFTGEKVDIKAFLPSGLCRARPRDGSRGNGLMQTDNLDIVHQLVSNGSVSIVPSGDPDDIYIIRYAKDNNGFIVSNDFFADHIRNMDNHSSQQSMFHWIRENRSGYTFVGNQEFMPNPASKLSLCISNKRAAESILALSTSESPFAASSSSSSAISSTATATGAVMAARAESLDVLTKAIDRMYALRREPELRYLLLARASLYMEVKIYITVLYKLL